jgi:hypothetical protein
VQKKEDVLVKKKPWEPGAPWMERKLEVVREVGISILRSNGSGSVG